jgi:hypothetical protein
MSDEKSNNIHLMPIDRASTVKPPSPENQNATRDNGSKKCILKPAVPQNQSVSFSFDGKNDGGNGGTGRPTPPPNPDTTKGGGK